MGILALYSDIDILQREEKVVTVADVKAIIDDAIENANRTTLKKLVKKLVGRNTDESDRIILKEEDFRQAKEFWDGKCLKTLSFYEVLKYNEDINESPQAKEY